MISVPLKPCRCAMPHERAPPGALPRTLLIGLIAFLTVVDLFAHPGDPAGADASLWRHPAAMGLAVNASTIGMAVAGLGVASSAARIDRRRGILVSLAAAGDPDRAPRRRAGPRHLHGAARRAGAVHGRGLHADARLSRRALQHDATPPAPLRPTSPATSRAICSGGCCRRRLADHLGLRPISSASPRSISPARRWSVSA